MELELKHILPYVTFGLKAIDTQYEYIREVTIWHGTYDLKTVGIYHLFSSNHLMVTKHIPILRPLSDLTKEIEVNGEKFVPLFKLFRLIHDYHIVDIPDLDISPENIKYQIDDDWNHCMTFVKEDVCLSYDKFEKRFNLMHEWETISFNYMEMHEKLLELHFDINLLIDANLAIDINTLNNQS